MFDRGSTQSNSAMARPALVVHTKSALPPTPSANCEAEPNAVRLLLGGVFGLLCCLIQPRDHIRDQGVYGRRAKALDIVSEARGPLDQESQLDHPVTLGSEVVQSFSGLGKAFAHDGHTSLDVELMGARVWSRASLMIVSVDSSLAGWSSCATPAWRAAQFGGGSNHRTPYSRHLRSVRARRRSGRARGNAQVAVLDQVDGVLVPSVVARGEHQVGRGDAEGRLRSHPHAPVPAPRGRSQAGQQ